MLLTLWIKSPEHLEKRSKVVASSGAPPEELYEFGVLCQVARISIQAGQQTQRGYGQTKWSLGWDSREGSPTTSSNAWPLPCAWESIHFEFPAIFWKAERCRTRAPHRTLDFALCRDRFSGWNFWRPFFGGIYCSYCRKKNTHTHTENSVEKFGQNIPLFGAFFSGFFWYVCRCVFPCAEKFVQNPLCKRDPLTIFWRICIRIEFEFINPESLSRMCIFSCWDGMRTFLKRILGRGCLPNKIGWKHYLIN